MKKTLCALIASATVLLAGAAQAGVTTFDELAPAGDYISLNDISPYAGLSWSGDWFAGDNTIDGYANAAHSGANFAVNGFGSDAVTIGSATGFNFAGAWFATPDGVGDKASWINISAYDSLNQLIGSTGQVAIGDAYSWVGAAFSNVSWLSITRDSGWYVMDDFTTSAGGSADVPEPATPLILAVGAVALMAARRGSAR
jgi:hypothetical protein